MTISFGYTGFDVVVIGASLGGLHAVGAILGRLPSVFPVPILIAQHLHRDQTATSVPELLGTRTGLDVVLAAHDAPLRAGTAYLAPPDQHLLLRPGFRSALHRGPRVNYSRPAIDNLFQSAAEICLGRTLAVVLTGRLFDGSQGAVAVRRAGGVVIAQDPATSVAPGMPSAAIATGSVDFVLPPDAIASALVSLVMVPGTAAAFGLPGRAA